MTTHWRVFALDEANRPEEVGENEFGFQQREAHPNAVPRPRSKRQKGERQLLLPAIFRNESEEEEEEEKNEGKMSEHFFSEKLFHTIKVLSELISTL